MVVQIHKFFSSIRVLHCRIITARPLIVVFNLYQAGVILLGLTLEAFVPQHLAVSMVLLVLDHAYVLSCFLPALGLESENSLILKHPSVLNQ